MIEASIQAMSVLPVAQRIRLLNEPYPSDIKLFGDPSRFQRLLGCLVLNACEAILKSSGGKGRNSGETLGSVVLFLQSREELGQVVVSIADSGPGFSQEIIERVHTPVLGGKAGKGIGLRLALGFVAEMGGSVELTNTGKGARVDVYLPAQGCV